MNDKEAKEILNHYLEMEEFDNAGDFLIAIDKVLSLLEKKEKQIDLMANNLIGVVFSNNDNKEILFDNKEDVKKYFENKEEESK